MSTELLTPEDFKTSVDHEKEWYENLWIPPEDKDLDWDHLLETIVHVFAPPGQAVWEPLPHQIPPDWDWFVWIIMGGRGTGKTAPGAKYMDDHMKGPACLPHVPGGHWASIVGPTLGDAVTSCIFGESGIRKWTPDIRVRQGVGGTECIWPNGATAKVFGAYQPEDVERFRAGGNRCFVWAEELAAWRYLQDAWDQIMFGLRVGPRPHIVATTTPKPRKLVREFRDKSRLPGTNIAITVGTTDDNPHLPRNIRQALYDRYGGTRLGLQELQGLILDDNPNALWKEEWLERDRIMDLSCVPEYYDRIVVAVDPAVSTNPNSNETGIIVAGLVNLWHPAPGYGPAMFTQLPHGFILDDLSGVLAPHEWAERVVYAYRKYQANRVVAEINQGGDLVKSNISTVDNSIPIKVVTATRGKSRRAEPVGSLYEQGRIHHIGRYPILEDQMLNYDPTLPEDEQGTTRDEEKTISGNEKMPGSSPDRMDALVWALYDMLVGRTTARKSKAVNTGIKGRR